MSSIDQDSESGRKADRYFGGIVALLALAFVVFAVPSISDEWLTATGSQYYTVGPGLMPTIAGLATMAFALISVLTPGQTNHLAGLAEPGAKRQVFLLIVLGFAYIAGLSLVGFLLATPVMLFIFLYGFGIRNWIVLPCVAVLAPLAIHLFFFYIFNLELPVGDYGISLR
tara:strand:+ start:329 stop:838 length:510 start_codon:yes stop_codon:yes gene_type:complete